MLTQVFRLNEIVQAIDETTCIWANAKILSFVSDWVVVVKWIDYFGYKPTSVEVPQHLRTGDREYWNIRKFQQFQHSGPVSRQQRRNKKQQVSVSLRTLCRNETVNSSSFAWNRHMFCSCISLVIHLSSYN